MTDLTNISPSSQVQSNYGTVPSLQTHQLTRPDSLEAVLTATARLIGDGGLVGCGLIGGAQHQPKPRRSFFSVDSVGLIWKAVNHHYANQNIHKSSLLVFLCFPSLLSCR